MDQINQSGLVMIGCGKMGSALLSAWLDAGLAPASVHVIDPYPSDWLKELAASGLTLNGALPPAPAVVVLATKPQMMAEALSPLAGGASAETLYLSVAAGTPIAFFESVLGGDARIVRTMPNTPALVGRGISALVANDAAKGAGMALAMTLMSAVGQAIELEDEEDLHTVTALSGSGPAYVFAFVEALVAAGTGLGLERDLALKLARETVIGAGLMIGDDPDELATLRQNVTSPGGTTAAGLSILQRDAAGIDDIIDGTLRAARDRSVELSRGTDG